MWAATLYPAANLSRNTNGSALFGSPYRAAICAPFGSTGGAAVHLRLSGCAITCWSSAIVAAGSSTAIANPAIKPNLFMETSPARGLYFLHRDYNSPEDRREHDH